jgi:hypothetical protein
VGDCPGLLDGHEVCGDEEDWIVEIKEMNANRAETLHPNRQGQAQYATEVDSFLEEKGVAYAPGFFQNGMPKNP